MACHVTASFVSSAIVPTMPFGSVFKSMCTGLHTGQEIEQASKVLAAFSTLIDLGGLARGVAAGSKPSPSLFFLFFIGFFIVLLIFIDLIFFGILKSCMLMCGSTGIILFGEPK